jgi:AcrR family transcriptional regulator
MHLEQAAVAEYNRRKQPCRAQVTALCCARVSPDRFSARKPARQSRARDTVDAILEASSRIVSAFGISHLTTNRIAEVAGVSIGSLYQYFPGKDAVLHALITREFNRVVDRHLAHIESIDPSRLSLEEAVASIVDHVFESQTRHRPFYRQILLTILSLKHFRFTLENDTRVLTAVRDKLAAYGIEGDDLDAGTFVALYALKGLQIGMVFSDRPIDHRTLRALTTRALVACVTPARSAGDASPTAGRPDTG